MTDALLAAILILLLLIFAGEGNKIVSLMANLSENFEVFVDDALRVETKVGFLIPMLEKLQLEAEVLEQDVEPVMVDTMKQLVNETKSIPATPKQRRSAPLPKICKQCGKEFVKGSVGGCCSKSCYNLAYRAKQELSEIACANCGKMFLPSRKDSKTCSPECYKETRRKPRSERKPVIPLPNQAKVNEKLMDEQARIEAVVAKAKDIAPSADFERHPTGPLMARKL